MSRGLTSVDILVQPLARGATSVAMKSGARPRPPACPPPGGWPAVPRTPPSPSPQSPGDGARGDLAAFDSDAAEDHWGDGWSPALAAQAAEPSRGAPPPAPALMPPSPRLARNSTVGGHWSNAAVPPVCKARPQWPPPPRYQKVGGRWWLAGTAPERAYAADAVAAAAQQQLGPQPQQQQQQLGSQLMPGSSSSSSSSSSSVLSSRSDSDLSSEESVHVDEGTPPLAEDLMPMGACSSWPAPTAAPTPATTPAPMPARGSTDLTEEEEDELVAALLASHRRWAPEPPRKHTGDANKFKSRDKKKSCSRSPRWSPRTP